MKTFHTLVAALLLVGAGLACGYFAHGFGASQRAVADFSRREPEATAPRAIEEKQGSGDFTTRLDALANTGDPSRRTRAIAAIADEFDVREIREALANLERHSVRDADEIRLQLLSRWAEFEPDAALKYAQGLPPGSVAPGAIAANDPPHALALAQELKLSWQAANNMVGVFDAWIGSNPQEAATHAAQLPPGALRDAALRRVAGQ